MSNFIGFSLHKTMHTEPTLIFVTHPALKANMKKSDINRCSRFKKQKLFIPISQIVFCNNYVPPPLVVAFYEKASKIEPLCYGLMCF